MNKLTSTITGILLGGAMLPLSLHLTGCARTTEDVETYLQEGIHFYAAEDLERARVQLRNALRLDPESAEAYYYLGLIARDKADYAGLKYMMVRATELDPEHISAQSELAEIAILSGDLPLARVAIAKLLLLAPTLEKTLQLDLALTVADAQWPEAWEKAQQALQQYPQSAELHGLLGVIEKNRGNAELALAAFDQAVNLSLVQNATQYRFLRLEVLQQQGNLLGMMADLESLAGTAADPAQYILQLVQLTEQTQGRQAAEQRLLQSIEQYPQAHTLHIYQIERLRKHDAGAAGRLLQAYIDSADSPTRLLFYRVSVALEMQHLELAQQDLTKLVAISDHDAVARAQAQALLAEVAFMRGDYAAAEGLLETVLRDNERHAGALLLQAKLLMQLGRESQAVDSLNRLLHLDPASVPALEILGRYYQQRGNTQLADNIYDRLLQLRADHREALIFKVSQSLARNFYSSADALLDQALANRQDDTELLSYKVQVSALRGQWAQAEAVLEQLQRLRLPAAQRQFLQGFIRRRQERFAEAVTHLGEAIRIQGIYDPALVLMRESALAANQKREWQRFLHTQINRQPQDYLARLYLAQELAATSAQQAQTLLQKGLDLNPDWIEGHMALAELVQRHGQGSEALAKLQPVYERTGDPRLASAMASLHIAAHEYSQAEALYQAVLAQNPNVPLVRNNYASLLTHQLYSPQNVLKAISLSEQFAQSENPMFLDTYGYALYRVGRHAEAEHTLRRALEFSQNPQIQYHYALALHASGRNRQARDILQRAKAATQDKALLENIEELMENLGN